MDQEDLGPEPDADLAAWWRQAFEALCNLDTAPATCSPNTETAGTNGKLSIDEANHWTSDRLNRRHRRSAYPTKVPFKVRPGQSVLDGMAGLQPGDETCTGSSPAGWCTASRDSSLLG